MKQRRLLISKAKGIDSNATEIDSKRKDKLAITFINKTIHNIQHHKHMPRIM